MALATAVLAAAATAQAAVGEAGRAPGIAVVTGALGPPATPPLGRRLTAREVAAVARQAPGLRRTLSRHRAAAAEVSLLPAPRWRVTFMARGRREVAEAVVDDRDARVLEAWSGIQARWPMARGQAGAFGRAATALEVWVPLLVLFLLPFARPPWRLLHLDLLVLASLSVSLAFFSHARVHASVPLACPPLLYLLLRMLAIARARGRVPASSPRVAADRAGSARTDPAGVRPLLGPAWLWAGAVFLLGFRLALQATSSNVIDVGYAGVIGADRIAHGGPLYGAFGADNPHGDTYGPLNYLAYVPFELLLPWSGTWDDLPAAHAAAAVFDLCCVALLAILGRRVGGPRLAASAVYLWLACPFTLLAANSGANDQLVGALVLAALVVAGSPGLRGVMIAAAAMVKFAPLALLPLFIRGLPPRASPRSPSRPRPCGCWRPRRAEVRTSAAAAAALAAGLALVLALDGGLTAFADRTIGFQLGRESPFSPWGLYDLHLAQAAAAAAAAGLALVVALAPRRRDLVSLAAMTAAVLLAVQIAAGHWFYLYLPWLLGPLLVALLGHYLPGGSGRSTGSMEYARPSSPERITTALSQGSSVAAS